MAEPIGSLVVRIGGDATDLLSAFQRAGKATEDLNSKLQSAVTGFKALASALAVREMAQFVKSIADTEDQLGKMAQKVGLSVEALSELKYSGTLADVSMEQLSVGLKQLAKHMQDAQTGTAEAVQVFRALKVEFESSPGTLRKTDAVLFDLADRFARMEDGAGKTALALKLFGKSGLDMIPLLNQGAEGLRANADEARKLGIVISTETAKAAEEFNDNLRRLNESSAALHRELAGPLIKALSDVAAEMIKAKKEGADFFDVMSRGMLTLFTGKDSDRWAKEFTNATNRLLDVQNALDAAKEMFKNTQTPFDADQIALWTKELAKAKAEVERLRGIGPILAPEEPGRKLPGTEKPPALVDLAKQTADALLYAKQWDEQMQEDAKTMAEVAALTDKYAASQRALNQGFVFGSALEKQLFDERMKATFDFIDREQEAAIEAGKAMVDAEGVTYTERLNRFLQLHDEEFAENERFRLAVQDLEQNFNDQDLKQLGGMHAVKEQMEQQHQQNLLRIRSQALNTAAQFTKAGYAQQAKTIFSELASITAGVSQHNRALFELNKVAGIAMAIVNAYEGISLTLAKYPYPLNIAMAAAHAVAAFAQVQAIRSATFGGGGAAAPSLAGATAAPPVTPVESATPGGGRGGPDTIINLHGDTFSAKQLRELFEQINEQSRDGGKIIFA